MRREVVTGVSIAEAGSDEIGGSIEVEANLRRDIGAPSIELIIARKLYDFGIQRIPKRPSAGAFIVTDGAKGRSPSARLGSMV